jgi:hypothetical protein
MRIKGDSSEGFTRAQLILLVCAAVVALIAGFPYVNEFIVARDTPATIPCVNNLIKINGAKEQWALETSRKPGAVPTDSDLFGASLCISEKPKCWKGGVYTLNPIGVAPTCTIPGHTLP